MKNYKRDIDEGWAWIVMLAAFLSQFVAGILQYGAGILHVAFIHLFQEDLTMTSLAGSLYCSLLPLLGPLVSVVINRWTCRVSLIMAGVLFLVGFSASSFAPNMGFLLVSYGIIAGSGLSFASVTSVVVIGYYFQKYRGVAIGFIVGGAGLGTLVAGPFLQFLIDTYGTRGTILLLGAFGAHCIVFGALLIPSELEMKQKSAKDDNSKETKKPCPFYQLTIFKDRCMLCIFFSSFLWCIPYFIVIIHLPEFAATTGVSEMNSALLILMIGLGSTINRFLAGIVLGPGEMDPVLLYFGFLGILGFASITFPIYFTIYSGQIIFSFIFGIYTGGVNVLINPLCVELRGIADLSTSVGFIYGFGGIGGLVGPPVAGTIIDLGGSYEDVFYISGILFFLAAFFVLVSTRWRKENVEDRMTSHLNINNKDLHCSSSLLYSDDRKNETA